MAYLKDYLSFALIFLGLVLIAHGVPSKFSLQKTTCNLLNSKFVASNSWTVYPIIYEPITKGRLTIWTGISTLPSSEFRCHESHNSTNKVVMDFANFANKLEWTFHDLNRGVIHNGITVNHCDDIKYEISINNKQLNSYMNCNTIDGIKLLNIDGMTSILHTTCQDCSHSLIALIDGQIRELIKTSLNEQIKENLYWHATQLLFSHHFNGPISLKYELD